MDPVLESYIRGLILTNQKNIKLSIPIVYHFTYKELFNYINSILSNNKFNISDSGLHQTRNNLTYEFLINIY